MAAEAHQANCENELKINRFTQKTRNLYGQEVKDQFW